MLAVSCIVAVCFLPLCRVHDSYCCSKMLEIGLEAFEHLKIPSWSDLDSVLNAE